MIFLWCYSFVFEDVFDNYTLIATPDIVLWLPGVIGFL